MRQNLISQGRTGKFMKYAVGEIILITLGVMIAVQINNWNQKRVIENEAIVTLNNLADNLQEEVFYNGLENAAERVLLTDSLLNNQLTVSDFRRDQRLSDLLSNYFRSEVMEENIETILIQESIVPKKYRSLITWIKNHKLYMDNYTRIRNGISEQVRRNEIIMEDNFPWYSLDDSLSNEHKYQFYLKNPYFRNRLMNLQKVNKRLISIYSISISQKADIAGEIKLLNENFGLDELIIFFNEMRLTRAEMIDCSAGDEGVYPFLLSHLFYNNTMDTLTYTPKQSSGGSVKILPKQLGFITRTDEEYIQFFSDNGCINFKVELNDYIIIE
ncbi:DUF6090 family protein [Algoriphagus sp. SE2]|uniref:DUF6090 family protein n=1 Tax=Algoriphagus sp. SE2 TaxID=3141536 RepID=UPI0031CCE711